MSTALPRFLLGAALVLALPGQPLAAFSPRFHEMQTRLAMTLVPRGMASVLKAHPEALSRGARGNPQEQGPTVEEVEAQFHRVVRLSEEGRRSEEIVRELGILARMTQLLADPSTLRGGGPLRDTYERFADEKTPRLVLTREPYWSLGPSLDPRPQLLGMAQRKYQRNHSLDPFMDPLTGQRTGSWDELSIPFAQLQLGFNEGVHSTANLWTLLWRIAGSSWN